MKLRGDLKGKTVALTGSTGGLGRELCFYLAEMGASLHLIDRNLDKSKRLEADIKTGFPETKISRTLLDLSDFSAVKAAAEELKQTEIDVLILNAAIYKVPREISNSGYDNVFTVNFLSHYYILRELMPRLRDRRGRIVALSSIAHRYSKSNPLNIDFCNVKSSEKVYGNSKRYLMYSLFELFADEKEIALSVVHPGISFTNITAHYPKLLFAIIKYPMKVIFMRPKAAAKCIMAGVFNDTAYGEWIGPALFDIWGKPKRKALKADSIEIKEVYKTAEKLYKELKEKEVQ